jgi:hypothetical protein
MQRNRAFLHRAVRYLASAGIRQFLDLGSGIPTLGNVHEVAHKARPDARVVYVDIDPVAVAHSRQILAGDERTIVVQEDLRNHEAIMGHPRVRELLDLAEPVAVIMLTVLHFIPDSDDPRGIIGRYVEPLVPGSFLALSHGTVDHLPPEAGEAMIELSRRTPTPVFSRSYAAIKDLFADLHLIEPGLVWTSQWRPEHPDDVGERPERSAVYAGVGRKL